MFVRVFHLLLRLNVLDPFFAKVATCGLLKTLEGGLIERADLSKISNSKRDCACRRARWLALGKNMGVLVSMAGSGVLRA